MRSLIAIALILFAPAAWAQCSFSNPTACGSPGVNNLAVGGTLTVGTFSPTTLSVPGATTLSGGGTLGGTWGGTPTFNGGTVTFSGGNPNIKATSRLAVGDGTGTSSTALNGTTASFRGVSFQTAGSNRWQFTWSGTETGSNAGSDWFLTGFADDGSTTLNSPIQISRKNQAIQIGSITSMNVTSRAVTYGSTLTSQAYTGGPPSTFTGNDYYYNYGVINSDNAAMGTSKSARGWKFTHSTGGAAMTGDREALAVDLNFTSASGNFGAGHDAFYTAVHPTVNISAGDGGSGLTASTAAGQFSAYNPQINVGASATNLDSVIVSEYNIGTASGSSFRTKTGLQIVKTSPDASSGSLSLDTALGIYDQGGTTAKWDYGLRFGGTSSAEWSINQTTGTIIGATSGQDYATTGAMTAGFGIDFVEVGFGNFAFRSPTFSVDGNGTVQVGAGLMKSVAAGVQVDPAGAIGTGTPTISAGGTGYPIGQTITAKNRTYGAVYRVVTNGSGVVTSVSSVVQQPIANTKSGLPATLALSVPGTDGSGLIVNVSWDTSRAELDLNPSGGNTIVGTGSALATNAAAGFLQIATMAGAPTGTVGAAGKAAVVIDTTNKKICYSTGGGTWECSAAFTP